MRIIGTLRNVLTRFDFRPLKSIKWTEDITHYSHLKQTVLKESIVCKFRIGKRFHIKILNSQKPKYVK